MHVCLTCMFMLIHSSTHKRIVLHCFLVAPRGTHLWEFIRDILIHPEMNQGLMKWEDRREGVFKFLKSEAVAQMWGQKKKNTSMTYEKLSRAMRWVHVAINDSSYSISSLEFQMALHFWIFRSIKICASIQKIRHNLHLHRLWLRR